MGNGDEMSGDGWKYRGRGCCQLTGKNNYTSYFLTQQKEVDGGDFIQNPDLLLQDKYFLDVGLYFWKLNNLDEVSNILECTKRINGGVNALQARTYYYESFKKILG